MGILVDESAESRPCSQLTAHTHTIIPSLYAVICVRRVPIVNDSAEHDKISNLSEIWTGRLQQTSFVRAKSQSPTLALTTLFTITFFYFYTLSLTLSCFTTCSPSSLWLKWAHVKPLIACPFHIRSTINKKLPISKNAIIP